MINFTLRGCGRIAKRHANLLGTGQIPGARLAAVCDEDRKRMACFAARYQIRGCESLDDRPELPGVGVVSVLTPSGLHADHAVRTLKHGKHGVVEEPRALTLVEDAARMIEAADAAGR